MNPVRRLDAFARAHPVVVDSLTAFLLWVPFGFGMLVVFASTPEYYPARPWAFHPVTVFVLSTLLIAPWSVRRVRPVASAAAVVAAGLGVLIIGPEMLPAMVVVPMTVHNLAVRAPRWASLTGLTVGLVASLAQGAKIAFFAVIFPSPEPHSSAPLYGDGIAMMLLCSLMVLAAWAFGDLARTRRLTMEALAERARRLEREAAQERALAAADERSHIAREMHDIVAHSLQVIISQADGGRYAAAAQPELAAQTLGTIGQTGRTALAEMRQLLGVLRAPQDDGAAGREPEEAGPGVSVASVVHRPQPQLSDLDELLETMRLAGLEATLAWDGAARRDLPAGGELAAYRTVQEALTNTLRHGGPAARADVRLAWTPRGLDITVDDDGRGAAADPATRGSGQGLRGLAERVRLFDGTAEAGPRSDGGFRVHAFLPYRDV